MEQENGLKSPVFKREGKNRQILGFTVSDAPLWVYRGVKEPAEAQFNDIYWMRIAQLLEREKQLFVLENAIENGIIYNKQPTVVEKQPEVVEEEKEEPSPYLGSARRK